MAVSGSLNVVSRSFIEGVCVVPLAPAVITMSRSTFHPRLMMLLMRIKKPPLKHVYLDATKCTYFDGQHSS